MEDELMHELAAGYAVDALGPDEERAFEEHLARCPRCREEVAALTAAAAQLAYASPPADPPAALRERIMTAVRQERSERYRPRPRWAVPALAAAALASCAAVGLGVWAATLHSRLDSPQALHALPLRGASGSVVVARGGSAALVVTGLPSTPGGKTYELWVIRGRGAEPAGLFEPGPARTTVVRLSRPLASGARVGVTVEPAGGSPQPTSAPVILSAPA